MRAFEVKKDACFQRGRIMMAIDGREDAVRKVEKLLNEDFRNTQCEEEGERDGEISITYVIDRSEKKDFMLAYKIAKAA